MVYEPLYHALHIWSCTRQFKIGSKLNFFFAKDRMAPEANRFNSFLRILENAISSGKKKQTKQTKKPQELV